MRSFGHEEIETSRPRCVVYFHDHAESKGVDSGCSNRDQGVRIREMMIWNVKACIGYGNTLWV